MASVQGLPPSSVQHMHARAPELKEPLYLNPGATNRLVLSLKSGLPSHISWALTRLALASHQHSDVLLLEYYPGLIETLLSFPFLLISAVNGAPPEAWEPSLWEQNERQYDGLASSGVPDAQYADVDDDGESETSSADGDDNLEDNGQGSAFAGVATIKIDGAHSSTRFDPLKQASHKRLLENAVAATLVLRNASLNERNERIFMVFSRAINTLVRDLLSLPLQLPSIHAPNEFSELEGIEELRVYALDILESTRVRLSLRRPLPLLFSATGAPLPPKAQFDHLLEMRRGEISGTEGTKAVGLSTSEQIFVLLACDLHTSSDRSVLIGALRCLGALAGEEKNQRAFVEMDVRTDGIDPINHFVSSPGLLKKCLSLLPLTQDTALLEATLDCLYQIVNVGDNALRLGCVQSSDSNGPRPFCLGIAQHTSKLSEDQERKAGTDDIRSTAKLLTRLLIYGRVVWDRTHQLTLHPALHMGIPSAIEMRRREHATIQRKRRKIESDERVRAKTRKLQRIEWLQLKDMAEPERLKAWMRVIYEPREHSEVSQMEFWTTYSTQFGPYSQLGGPPLQPAAEVIRTVSSVFPGAIAMVLPNQKFVVRGVEARDRSFVRRFECRWRGCEAPETDTHGAMESHIIRHVANATDVKCAWERCTFVAPDGSGEPTRTLRMHALTHLPETDEQVAAREGMPKRSFKERDRDSEPRSAANGIRNNAPATPGLDRPEQVERLTVDYEKLEARRKAMLSRPIRGTVDWPDTLPFCVTRTPMDSASGRPVGIAATASLIIRTLARTSSSELAKAGARKRARAGGSDDADVDQTGVGAKSIGGSVPESERFGFPLFPQSEASFAVSETEHHINTMGSGDSAPYVRLGEAMPFAGTEASATNASSSWTEEAAINIMDALLDCEDGMMRVASENDILCPALNDALGVLHAQRGESMLQEDGMPLTNNVLVRP